MFLVPYIIEANSWIQISHWGAVTMRLMQSVCGRLFLGRKRSQKQTVKHRCVRSLKWHKKMITKFHVLRLPKWHPLNLRVVIIRLLKDFEWSRGLLVIGQTFFLRTSSRWSGGEPLIKFFVHSNLWHSFLFIGLKWRRRS